LDDFLNRHQGGFLEHLRYDQLLAAIGQRPILVEGVCLLAVLERIAVNVDVVVYVFSSEEVGRREEGESGSILSKEISYYNQKFGPARRADIFFTGTAALADKGARMDRDRVDIDIAFIQAKTKLAITIAIGGMLALVVGLVVLLYGVTGNDRTLVKIGTLEMSASGLGGVIMATSALWAFFAYKTRPVYSRAQEVSEKFDSNSRLLERRERRGDTEIGISLKKDD
jgi:hypothetical protein